MISDETIDMIKAFSHARNWGRYHTEERLAKSICIEAAELLECYQWQDSAKDGDMEHVREELADVLIYCIQMAQLLNVDLDEIIRDKMAKNAIKHPVGAPL